MWAHKSVCVIKHSALWRFRSELEQQDFVAKTEIISWPHDSHMLHIRLYFIVAK